MKIQAGIFVLFVIFWPGWSAGTVDVLGNLWRSLLSRTRAPVNDPAGSENPGNASCMCHCYYYLPLPLAGRWRHPVSRVADSRQRSCEQTRYLLEAAYPEETTCVTAAGRCLSGGFNSHESHRQHCTVISLYCYI